MVTPNSTEFRECDVRTVQGHNASIAQIAEDLCVPQRLRYLLVKDRRFDGVLLTGQCRLRSKDYS